MEYVSTFQVEYNIIISYPKHATHSEARNLTETYQGFVDYITDQSMERPIQEISRRRADFSVDGDKKYENFIDIVSDS